MYSRRKSSYTLPNWRYLLLTTQMLHFSENGTGGRLSAAKRSESLYVKGSAWSPKKPHQTRISGTGGSTAPMDQAWNHKPLVRIHTVSITLISYVGWRKHRYTGRGSVIVWDGRFGNCQSLLLTLDNSLPLWCEETTQTNFPSQVTIHTVHRL